MEEAGGVLLEKRPPSFARGSSVQPITMTTRGRVVRTSLGNEEGDAEESHDMFCACCRGLLTSALPPELLVDVFSLLSVREVCLQVALTCRAWHVLSHNQTLWQRLFLAHFAEELDDKRNRFRLLRMRRELIWRSEFEQCVRASSRDIRVHLHMRRGHSYRSADIVVNARDPMSKLLKKASRALNVPSTSYKIVFSFVEMATHHYALVEQREQRQWLCRGSREHSEDDLDHGRWLEFEAYEERTIRSEERATASQHRAQVPSNSALLNRVHRLFLMERRHRRIEELRLLERMMNRSAPLSSSTGAEVTDVDETELDEEEQDDDDTPSDLRGGTSQNESERPRIRMAMVVVEDGDGGPCQRQENLRLNPPLVTYYVNGGQGSPKEERVGFFLAEGSVGTCLVSHRHLLIDM